jgi:hypothetical protein
MLCSEDFDLRPIPQTRCVIPCEPERCHLSMGLRATGVYLEGHRPGKAMIKRTRGPLQQRCAMIARVPRTSERSSRPRLHA